MLNQKILTLATMATVVSLGCTTPAHAGPITYALTSTGTGTFGGTPFTDAVVTVTLVGDTSTVIPVGRGLFNPGTATVNS
jgi:hypothetical protein